jgi:predicted DsbA family dithiol-disulfide isomerase
VTVKVEIFSDIVCPWCAIGKRRFEAALAQFEHADEVEVIWRSFELNPGAPRVSSGDSAALLAAKYGMTREQALQTYDKLTATAAEVGLDFRFDKSQHGNTFDAHRLLHFAQDQGVQGALKERLLIACFTEGEAIGDPETLVRLAAAVGLDPEGAAEVLASDRYADAVRADERDATELGVTGVPFFVVGGRFGIPGAQDPETILRVLIRACDADHPLTIVSSGDEGACEGDTCSI